MCRCADDGDNVANNRRAPGHRPAAGKVSVDGVAKGEGDSDTPVDLAILFCALQHP